MADAEEVLAHVRADDAELSGLVLNERGFERLRATSLDRVNCTLAVTETFNRRNANASLGEAIARVESILAAADRPATVTLSVCFGCPFEGRVDPARVVELAARFRGVEVVVADTIGVATPTRVRRLVEATGARGFHGHNTRNTGYANALAALDAGATRLDASRPIGAYSGQRSGTNFAAARRRWPGRLDGLRRQSRKRSQKESARHLDPPGRHSPGR